MKLVEIFVGVILAPWPTISTGIHSPGPPGPWTSTQEPRSGLRGCYVLWSCEKERPGDTLTCKQNSWATVGKSRSGLPSLATADSDQVHKAPESWLPSLATADDGNPDCLISFLLRLIRSPKLRSPDYLISLLLGTIWTLDSLEISCSSSRPLGARQIRDDVCRRGTDHLLHVLDRDDLGLGDVCVTCRQSGKKEPEEPLLQLP